ncbi:MAG: hypothetical protein IM638_15270 [Bacteroidetes bacterium]|nr:hypothetical protein [Bacteroidota bacterium]
MNEIHHNPASGELLKHNLQGLTSYHFNRKPEMRIIYAVYSCHERKEGILSCRFDDILHTDEELETCNGLIEFLFVKTREELNNGYKVIKDTAARLKRE